MTKIHRYGSVLACLAMVVLGLGARVAQAQTSYPLYCQGPLTTSAPTPPPAGATTTPFVWASTGAGAQSPGAGQCAWADRAAGGLELQGGNGNVICDARSLMLSLPAGGGGRVANSSRPPVAARRADPVPLPDTRPTANDAA